MNCNCPQKPVYITLYRGDDSNFTGNQSIYVKIETERSLSGCKAYFKYMGYLQTFNSIPDDKKLQLVFPSSETKEMPLGTWNAELYLVDSNNRRHTVNNRINILVTNSVKEAYDNDDPQAITVTVHGGDFVKTVNNQKPDANGNVNVEFELEPATADKLGGIKVGDGLSVETDGTLKTHDYVPLVADKDGNKTAITVGNRSTDPGYDVVGPSSFANGDNCTASGEYSHAEGEYSEAKADYSHAEGNSVSEGKWSHSEGAGRAKAEHSHAEGDSTTTGKYSHAEGSSSWAIGDFSHAEGFKTQANGKYSHSEGGQTQANGKYSHSCGEYSEATHDSSFVFGGVGSTPYYKSHGDGTFNIKPKPQDGTNDHTSGFFIGEKSLKELLNERVSKDELPYSILPTTGALKDRTINTISTGGVFSFPSQISSKSRDFVLAISALEEAPSITFPTTGITYVSEQSASDIWSAEPNKVNVWYFSEISSNTFSVVHKAFSVVEQ